MASTLAEVANSHGAVQELAERAKLRAEIQVAVAERQQTCRALTAGIMALNPGHSLAMALPAAEKSLATHPARNKPSESCFTPQTPADVASAVSRASRLVASDRHSRFLESRVPSAAAERPASPVMDVATDLGAGVQALPSSVGAPMHPPCREDRTKVHGKQTLLLC